MPRKPACASTGFTRDTACAETRADARRWLFQEYLLSQTNASFHRISAIFTKPIIHLSRNQSSIYQSPLSSSSLQPPPHQTRRTNPNKLDHNSCFLFTTAAELVWTCDIGYVVPATWPLPWSGYARSAREPEDWLHGWTHCRTWSTSLSLRESSCAWAENLWACRRGHSPCRSPVHLRRNTLEWWHGRRRSLGQGTARLEMISLDERRSSFRAVNG